MNLDFRILFPAPNVFWHVEFYFFLEESVHLALNGIWLALDDKGSGVVNNTHLIEVFVCAGVSSHDVELSIENVFAVTSVVNTIIYNQLDHDLFGIFAMER